MSKVDFVTAAHQRNNAKATCKRQPLSTVKKYKELATREDKFYHD